MGRAGGGAGETLVIPGGSGELTGASGSTRSKGDDPTRDVLILML